MKNNELELVLVSTPIGYLGSGRGGGVELTLCSLMKGLLDCHCFWGHQIVGVRSSIVHKTAYDFGIC